MLNKRIALIVSVLTIVVIGLIYVLSQPTQKISEEVQAHIDKLYTFSGELTPEEKESYFENGIALTKLLIQEGTLPEKEMEKMQDHVRKLIINNPDLVLSAREYDKRFGDIVGNTHGYTHGEDYGEDYQKEKQIVLEKIEIAITELDTLDFPNKIKEDLRSILNRRRESLTEKDKAIDELNKAFIEFLKKDPDVDGVTQDQITGEYIPTYPNMIKVYRRRTHNVDGTIDDEVTGILSSSTPENQKAIQAYLTELENTPPWMKQPDPPDIEGLRFSVEYEDVHLNSKEVITDKVDQSVNSNTPDKDTMKVLNPDEQPGVEEHWTDITENVIVLQHSLKDIDDPQIQSEATIFLEKALGVKLDRFLQLSEVEIDNELQKMFAATSMPRHTGIRATILPKQPPVTDITMIENNLSKNFSQIRTQRAIATLNELGPMKGLERLKEIDPEIAKQLEDYIQEQDKQFNR